MTKKIAVIHLLGRDTGWEESWFVLSLAGAMARRELRTLVAAPPGSWAGNHAGSFGVEFEPLVIGSPSNPLTWIKVGSLAKKAEAAVVHAHDPAAALVSSRSRLPAGCRRAATLYRNAAVNGFAAKTDFLFAASRLAEGMNSPGEDGDGAHVVHAGADAEAAKAAEARRDATRAKFIGEFCPAKEKPLFIAYAAPFEEASRHRALLEALQDILTRLPQTHLLLPGDGPDYAELERQSRIMALEKDVTFLEPEPDFPDLMAASDLYISPRRDDEAGIMVQSAMAAGRAVVAAASGANPELLDDGKAGVLADPDKPGDLLSAVLDLLQNRNRRDHFGRLAAARAAKNFNLALTTDAIIKTYAVR